MNGSLTVPHAQTMPATLDSALREATDKLTPTHESARADAEVLLACVRKRPRHEVMGFPERPIDAASLTRYRTMVEQRRRGVPVAHLTGRREFWSLSLKVTADTLIPRPETEHLVECALELLPPDSAAEVADLGTGSGAVALAIASERPASRFTATDTSAAALSVASANAARLDINNVHFVRGHWYQPLAGRMFHLIVSNPPYVAEADTCVDRGDLRFEPRDALVSGTDGLTAIEEIIHEAGEHLLPGGWLALEHGATQSARVRALMADYGFNSIGSIADLAGHPRVALGRHGTGPVRQEMSR